MPCQSPMSHLAHNSAHSGVARSKRNCLCETRNAIFLLHFFPYPLFFLFFSMIDSIVIADFVLIRFGAFDSGVLPSRWPFIEPDQTSLAPTLAINGTRSSAASVVKTLMAVPTPVSDIYTRNVARAFRLPWFPQFQTIRMLFAFEVTNIVTIVPFMTIRAGGSPRPPAVLFWASVAEILITGPMGVFLPAVTPWATACSAMFFFILTQVPN